MTCVHAHSHININASGFTNSPGKQFSLQSITSTAQSQTEHTVCTIIMIMVYRTCHKDTHRQKILSKCYDNDMVYVPDSIYHIETHLHTRYSMMRVLCVCLDIIEIVNSAYRNNNATLQYTHITECFNHKSHC